MSKPFIDSSPKGGFIVNRFGIMLFQRHHLNPNWSLLMLPHAPIPGGTKPVEADASKGKP